MNERMPYAQGHHSACLPPFDLQGCVARAQRLSSSFWCCCTATQVRTPAHDNTSTCAWLAQPFIFLCLSFQHTLASALRYLVFPVSAVPLQVYLPMSYAYGKRGTCKETPLTAAIRGELYTQSYGSIDWNAARNQCAKEDLYYPHPKVSSPCQRTTLGTISV